MGRVPRDDEATGKFFLQKGLVRVHQRPPPSTNYAPNNWRLIPMSFSEALYVGQFYNLAERSKFLTLRLIVVPRAFTITCSTSQTKSTRKATAAFYRGGIALLAGILSKLTGVSSTAISGVQRPGL